MPQPVLNVLNPDTNVHLNPDMVILKLNFSDASD